MEKEGLVDLEHPWLGLGSFDDKTSNYFFGRRAEVAELLLRLKNYPLTVIYSRSGLGKTSLLRAGLIPELRLLDQHPVFYRIDYAKGAASPAEQLRIVLEEEPAPKEKPPFELPTDVLSLLWLALHQSKKGPRWTQLILDQFEEVFTLGAHIKGACEELRDALGIILHGTIPPAIEPLLAREDFVKYYDCDVQPLPVILSLRDDYVFALRRWRTEIPGIDKNYFELGELRGLDALAAIYEPGRLRTRYRQEGQRLVPARVRREPIIPRGVAENLVRQLAEKPLDTKLEAIEAVPPILSLVCQQLNSRRFTIKDGVETQVEETISAAQLEKGPSEILSQFYEDSFAGRPPGIRHLLENHLLDPDGNRVPVAAEALYSLAERYHLTKEVLQSQLNELLARRLINTNSAAGTDRYELVHDRLRPIVRESRALREEREATERANARAESEREAREELEKLKRKAEDSARQANIAQEQAATEAARASVEAESARVAREEAAAAARRAKAEAGRANELARQAREAERKSSILEAFAVQQRDEANRQARRSRLLSQIVIVAAVVAVALGFTIFQLIGRARAVAAKQAADRAKAESQAQIDAEKERIREERLAASAAEFQINASRIYHTRAAGLLEVDLKDLNPENTFQARRRWPEAVANLDFASRYIPGNWTSAALLWSVLRYGPAARDAVATYALDIDRSPTPPAYNPDGSTIATFEKAGNLVLFDYLHSKVQRASIPTGLDPANLRFGALHWTLDGESILAYFYPRRNVGTRQWARFDLKPGAWGTVFTPPPPAVRTLAWNEAGTQIAVWDNAEGCRILSASSVKEIRRFRTPKLVRGFVRWGCHDRLVSISGVSVSGVSVSGTENVQCVFDVSSGKDILASTRFAPENPISLTLDKDNQQFFVLSTNEDRDLSRLCHLTIFRADHNFQAERFEGKVLDAAWWPGHDRLLIVDADGLPGTVSLVDLKRKAWGHSDLDDLEQISTSRNGKLVFAFYRSGKTAIFQEGLEEPMTTLNGDRTGAGYPSFSPDGHLLSWPSSDNLVLQSLPPMWPIEKSWSEESAEETKIDPPPPADLPWEIDRNIPGCIAVRTRENKVLIGWIFVPMIRGAKIDWDAKSQRLSVDYGQPGHLDFNWNPPQRYEPAVRKLVEAIAGTSINDNGTDHSLSSSEQAALWQDPDLATLKDPAWKELRDWWLAGRPIGSAASATSPGNSPKPNTIPPSSPPALIDRSSAPAPTPMPMPPSP